MSEVAYWLEAEEDTANGVVFGFICSNCGVFTQSNDEVCPNCKLSMRYD